MEVAPARVTPGPPTITASAATEATQSSGRPTESKKAMDKYSALKELDEIFKSTVTVNDGQSAGASIFGSSPLATQPVNPSPITNVFGPSPTNFSSPS